MPTTNVVVGTTWTQIAAATDEGFIASSHEVGYIAYATTATTTPPPSSLIGHVFRQDERVGRGDLGPGYVWAKVLPPDVHSVVAVTK